MEIKKETFKFVTNMKDLAIRLVFVFYIMIIIGAGYEIISNI